MTGKPPKTAVPVNAHLKMSLTYNAGAKGARDTFRFVNQNDFAGAAANISSLIRVGIVEGGKKKMVIAPGLIKRRAEESAPFRAERSTTNVN